MNLMDVWPKIIKEKVRVLMIAAKSTTPTLLLACRLLNGWCGVGSSSSHGSASSNACVLLLPPMRPPALSSCHPVHHLGWHPHLFRLHKPRHRHANGTVCFGGWSRLHITWSWRAGSCSTSSLRWPMCAASKCVPSVTKVSNCPKHGPRPPYIYIYRCVYINKTSDEE